MPFANGHPSHKPAPKNMSQLHPRSQIIPYWHPKSPMLPTVSGKWLYKATDSHPCLFSLMLEQTASHYRVWDSCLGPSTSQHIPLVCHWEIVRIWTRRLLERKVIGVDCVAWSWWLFGCHAGLQHRWGDDGWGSLTYLGRACSVTFLLRESRPWTSLTYNVMGWICLYRPQLGFIVIIIFKLICFIYVWIV